MIHENDCFQGVLVEDDAANLEAVLEPEEGDEEKGDGEEDATEEGVNEQIFINI